jgi:hypothetical protein
MPDTNSVVAIYRTHSQAEEAVKAQWTQTDKIRAARCLRAQGWVRCRERQGDRLEWRYRKVV